MDAASPPEPSNGAPDAAPDGRALYLDLLKRSLLGEVYLDNELRLIYLRDCLAGAEAFDPAVLHDIRAARPADFAAMREGRRDGRFFGRSIRNAGFSHSMMGRARMDMLHDLLDRTVGAGVPGDLVECGVWRGGACIFMAGWLRAHGLRRRIVVADSFDGLPVPTAPQDAKLDLNKAIYPELAVSLETVRANFEANGLLSEDVVFLPGWFRDTLRGLPDGPLALLRLDGDLYESTTDALEALYDRVSPGGAVIVDDYGLKPCREAVADFFARRGEAAPELTLVDWTGAYFLKAA